MQSNGTYYNWYYFKWKMGIPSVLIIMHEIIIIVIGKPWEAFQTLHFLWPQDCKTCKSICNAQLWNCKKNIFVGFYSGSDALIRVTDEWPVTFAL